MKRIGGLVEATCSRENVERAIREARKRRSKKNALADSMRVFFSDYEASVQEVMRILRTGEWDIKGYRTFRRREHGKVRKIDWNPSFRDSVIQHALYQTVGTRLNATLIPDTFAGIKGRGMHHGMRRIMDRIRREYPEGTPLYVLKADIRHYYESIDNGRLKDMLRRKLKDHVIVKLLCALVDSHPDGLPIGNYLSQLLANFYLGGIDRLALSCGVDWFRYCDDVVALSKSKSALRLLMQALSEAAAEAGLAFKRSWQVFPIWRGKGLDYMGFVMSRTGVLLRKRIERGLRRAARLLNNFGTAHFEAALESYRGWTCWLSRGCALMDSVLRAA